MKKQKIDNSYMVGKVCYVTCTRCGREIKGVGEDTISALCSYCVINIFFCILWIGRYHNCFI